MAATGRSWYRGGILLRNPVFGLFLVWIDSVKRATVNVLSRKQGRRAQDR